MSKKVTRNLLSEINRILDISDSYQAPEKVMSIIRDPEIAKQYYFKFMKLFDYDFFHEWFNDYFAEEHADRKTNKQDFTPTCVSNLMAEIFGDKEERQNGIVYEPAAGTGSTIIAHWYKERQKYAIWNYNPLSYLYICEELSDKTIPFLLFNILIRGMNAVVIHGNTLTRQAKAVYHCFNEENNSMGFSTLFELPKNERTETMFNVRF